MNKNIFRNQCKIMLKKCSKNRIKHTHNVIDKLEFLINDLDVKTILTFIPSINEVNIKKLNNKLRKSHILTTTFMQGVSLKTVKYKLPFEKKKFGIHEPPDSNFKLYDIDLAIVPVIGVDAQFRRVGFGKGFYDRYFGTLKKKPILVFVQLCKCYTDQDITQSHDIQADYYITSKDFIKIRHS